MKHLKLYEDIDWGDEDFDQEEFNDDYEGDYYLTNIGFNDTRIILRRIYIKKSDISNDLYDYFNWFDNTLMWKSMRKSLVESDLKHETYNSIRLFQLDEWGSDKMKKVWKDLTGKELPKQYKGKIVEDKNVNENFEFNDNDFDFEEEENGGRLGEEIKVVNDSLFDVEVFFSRILQVISDKRVVVSHRGHLSYADFENGTWWCGEYYQGEVTEDMVIATYTAEFGDKLVSISQRLGFADKMNKVTDFGRMEIYDMIKNHYRK